MFNFANGIGKFLCEYENDKEQKKEQFLTSYEIIMLLDKLVNLIYHKVVFYINL